MAVYVDKDIKNTKRIFPMQGREEFLRLDMNESITGLPGDFVREVLSEITPEFLCAYPEPERFIGAYSSFLGVSPERVTVTNGTDSAIRYILQTFGEKGKDVLTVSPTFEMYRINCSILGYNHVAVAYGEDFIVPVEDILRAITENTRIVVLLNPNNPMGDTYSSEDAARIIEAAGAVNALVLIDEAYHYFTDESLLALSQKYDNVLVLRTFSKLMSLAGLRLGAVIGNPELIGYVNNGKLSFEVNSMALLFGERLIKRPDIIKDLIRREKEGKEYLTKRLKEAGYEFRVCKGNYILIKTKRPPKDVVRALEKEDKILVHGYGGGILSDYIRVTTGDARIMEKFAGAFLSRDVLGE